MWKVRGKKQNDESKKKVRMQMAEGKKQKRVNSSGLPSAESSLALCLRWAEWQQNWSGTQPHYHHHHHYTTTPLHHYTSDTHDARRQPAASRAHFSASVLSCRCGPAADPVSCALYKFIFIYICTFSLLNKSTQK